MCGGRSTRDIAADFNTRHPDMRPISNSTVHKIITKFRETGSIVDRQRTGRPRSARSEEVATNVLASIVKNPARSTRQLSLETGISQRSILRILHDQKLHSYKVHMLHHFNEDDPDRPMETADWALEQAEADPCECLGDNREEKESEEGGGLGKLICPKPCGTSPTHTAGSSSPDSGSHPESHGGYNTN
ncbi:hypothetical protein GDO78_007542 [Eleutherodactylus coqui]|uniref:DUF4817 domain-containing protein n=2 Tax=Eleutherodactylus coqui TaxID=57060 RepID=A0A8J6KCF8_ELECQ|nr:hypothetical protein GDO78_007542 [Eleutherodactylus coqui]